MTGYGDFESVNLGTGERGQRVTGNGESRLMTEREVIELLEKARRVTKPIVERELAGECPGQGLMEFWMR